MNTYHTCSTSRGPVPRCLSCVRFRGKPHHRSAGERYNVIKNIRREQDTWRCIVVDDDILDIWPEVHSSSFGVVDKANDSPTVVLESYPTALSAASLISCCTRIPISLGSRTLVCDYTFLICFYHDVAKVRLALQARTHRLHGDIMVEVYNGVYDFHVATSELSRKKMVVAKWSTCPELTNFQVYLEKQ